MEKIICSKCGTEILPGYRFCPKCGKVVPLNSFEISKPENIKITPVKQYEESAINAEEKENKKLVDNKAKVEAKETGKAKNNKPKNESTPVEKPKPVYHPPVSKKYTIEEAIKSPGIMTAKFIGLVLWILTIVFLFVSKVELVEIGKKSNVVLSSNASIIWSVGSSPFSLILFMILVFGILTLVFVEIILSFAKLKSNKVFNLISFLFMLIFGLASIVLLVAKNVIVSKNSCTLHANTIYDISVALPFIAGFYQMILYFVASERLKNIKQINVDSTEIKM